MSKDAAYYESLKAAQKEVEEGNKEAGVDTKPISPVERRNSLEKHLQVSVIPASTHPLKLTLPQTTH